MAEQDKIIGYNWSDIQRVQQRHGRLSTSIDVSKPQQVPTLTDADRALLAEYGTVEALEAAGFYGISDRIRRGAR
jgi:hypothetical protein